MTTTTVIRTSMLTGREQSRVIPLAPEVYDACVEAYHSGLLLQDAFPMLSADDREFIKTGITPEEWALLNDTGE